MNVTDTLTDAFRRALARHGMPEPRGVVWQLPRGEHGADYATPSAMAYAKQHGLDAVTVVAMVVAELEALPEVANAEGAGPGFINVILARDSISAQLRGVLAAGARVRREPRRRRAATTAWNSCPPIPTGPLVIVNARAAAVGDALARILRSQGARVESEYYVNDAGNQFQALAASVETRLRQALGEPAELPENAYPGEYLIEFADELARARPRGARAALALPEAGAARAAGPQAVAAMVAGHRAVLSRLRHRRSTVVARGGATCAAAGLPERALALLAARGPHLRAGRRPLVPLDRAGRRQGPRAPEVGRRAHVLRGGHRLPPLREVRRGRARRSTSSVRTITAISARIRAAMRALGHPDEAFDILIVQLVTLLRDGQPVRMSKRRGEFVLMEELLEEVGRDAARFTFLTRRHDSPLDFDLAVATRQSRRQPGLLRPVRPRPGGRASSQTAAQQGVEVPPWDQVDLDPARASRGAGADQARDPVHRGPDGRRAGARAAPPRVLSDGARRRVPPLLQGASDHHRGSPD